MCCGPVVRQINMWCVGAPAAEASHPGEEEGDGELQAEAIAVPLRGQGGAATPVTDVGMLFAQNQSKLKALKVSLGRLTVNSGTQSEQSLQPFTTAES